MMTALDRETFPEEIGMFPEIIPGFNSLELKAKIRAEIYEETKHMTPAQRMEHTRQASERFREEIRLRRAERAKLAEANG
jgi:hypothetical protein